MAKKTSRQAIEKRINKAFESMLTGDMEEALFNIAPVIDIVAKERFKQIKLVGDRIKAYISEEQDLIYYLSYRGKFKILKGVQIAIVDHQNIEKPPPNIRHIKTHSAQLADYIYHNIRCAQSHDAEIDYDIIDLGRNYGIGREGFEGDGGELAPGKFIVSNATILAIVLVVVASPEIKRIKLQGHFTLNNTIMIDKQKLVGNREYLEKKLQSLFKPDVAGNISKT